MKFLDRFINKKKILMSSNKSEIIALRKSIIERIRQHPSTQYSFGSFLWEDAAAWVPGWHKAGVYLDLITGKLCAFVEMYPNQFGYSPESTVVLTASRFNKMAREGYVPAQWLCMQTERDWEELFDDELKAEVTKAQISRAEEEERLKRREEEAKRIAYAVVIPDGYADIEPKMEYAEIEVSLSQRYAGSGVLLKQAAGKYVLQAVSAGSNIFRRELTRLEAAWMEQQIKECVENQDETTWQSLPGGDRMTVKINKQDESQIEQLKGTPLKKYIDLMLPLINLAQYGSISEAEKQAALEAKQPSPQKQKSGVDNAGEKGEQNRKINTQTPVLTFPPEIPQEKKKAWGEGEKAVLKWRLHTDGTVEIIETFIGIKGIFWHDKWNAVIRVPEQIDGHPVTRISGDLGWFDFSVEAVPFSLSDVQWHIILPATVREISSDYISAEEIQPEDFMISDCSGIWHKSDVWIDPKKVIIYGDPGSYAQQFAQKSLCEFSEQIPDFVLQIINKQE